MLISSSRIVQYYSDEGLDITVFHSGVYHSPCGKYWSNRPYTREQKASYIIENRCIRHQISMNALHKSLTKGEKQNLPKWVKLWFLENYKLNS